MNREKELLLRMTGTIVTIVLCLAAMGFSAFAYFSHSISSGMNVIQSAHFDVVVTLMEDKGALNEDGGEVGQAEEKSDEPNGTDTEAVGGSTSGTNGTVLTGNRLDRCEAKVYAFKIEASGDAQTGYCKIVIKKDESEQVYYTTQLYLHPDENKGQKNALTIEIDMTNGSEYTIEFIPQWGTSSCYAEAQNNLLGENGRILFTPAASTDEEIVGSDEDVAEDSEGAQTEDGTEPEPGVKEYYTVVSGDTLQMIAAWYGLTQNELYEFNKNEIKDPDILNVGQVLKIPISTSGAESESETENMTESPAESMTEVATETAPEKEPSGEVKP